MILISGIGPAMVRGMCYRSRKVLDDTEILEETNGHVTALSDAEVAACTCPDLCIRDHEHE